MDAKEAILSRRSVRKFLDKRVPRELINELLSAADAAPSACNKRPVRFFVIESPEVLSKLNEAGRFSGISAPLAIVVAADMKATLPRSFGEYWIQDASAATENILIMANALGLGSCWCGVYLQRSVMEKVAEALGLDENIIPFSLIKIGYPDETVEPHAGYEKSRVSFIK